MWLQWNVDEAEVRLAGLNGKFPSQHMGSDAAGPQQGNCGPERALLRQRPFHHPHVHGSPQNVEHTGFTTGLVETHRRSF